MVCPCWVGYFLLNPLRNLFESPNKVFDSCIRPGMVVLEPGCGMGFFTLPLARMVGEAGKVIAVDIQPGMLARLKRRAGRAGLTDRIQLRKANESGLNIEDLHGTVDFAAAIHVVHETPNPGRFFREIFETLRPGGRLLMIEPRGHVSRGDFFNSMAKAESVGFRPASPLKSAFSHRVLLFKP